MVTTSPGEYGRGGCSTLMMPSGHRCTPRSFRAGGYVRGARIPDGALAVRIPSAAARRRPGADLRDQQRFAERRGGLDHRSIRSDDPGRPASLPRCSTWMGCAIPSRPKCVDCGGVQGVSSGESANGCAQLRVHLHRRAATGKSSHPDGLLRRAWITHIGNCYCGRFAPDCSTCDAAVAAIPCARPAEAA